MCPQFLTLQPLDGTHGFTAELDRHDEASRCIYFGIDPRTLEDV